MKDGHDNVLSFAPPSKAWKEREQDFPDHKPAAERSPATRVPEPEEWPEPHSLELPDVPPAIPAGEEDGDKRTIAVVDVANRIIRAVDRAVGEIVHEDGRFWLYREGFFCLVKPGWIDECVYAYDGEEGKNKDERGNPVVFRYDPQTSRTVPELMGKRLDARQRHVDGRYFDGPLAVAFRNCSLGLDTLLPTEHSPEHRCSSALDVDYDPEAEPHWLPLVMRDWFAGEPEEEIAARILALRQYAGHAILGTLPRMKLSLGLMLVGEGHDGKSAFIDLVRACMPADSVKDVDPGELTSKSLAVDVTRASLLGKMLNVCDDCSGQIWHDTGFLKRLLDHGSLNVRRIGRDPSVMAWRGATLYACNSLPTVKDTSHGFQRRWRLVHFPNRVPQADRDPSLVRKLMALERHAIVNWFVRAAKDMLEGPRSATIAKPACHEALMGRWMAGDDCVAEWVRTCSDPGPDKASWERIAMAYEACAAFERWRYGRQPLTRDVFSRRLSMLGVERGLRGKANERVVRLVIRK